MLRRNMSLTLKGNELLTDEHLDNLLPGGEALDENVRWFELMRGSVLLDLGEY